jgi:para-aminobenzoate synthetase/4-amino-4-deoxychorismate lyase
MASLPVLSSRSPFSIDTWTCDTGEADYREAIRRIKDYIREGDTYQVNYTVRLRSRFTGEPYSLFRQLVLAQQARCAVYVHTDGLAICSASPELFVERDGRRIVSRPMKGTAARGLTSAGDRLVATALAACEKNRAENVMITDMIRNDIGRIAVPGSVQVSRLFEVETYPTLHQMVSTVEAVTDADLSGTLTALFPCASITGAPKVRTMQIIRELERSPRGVYTGMCGYWMPGDRARFNVAIRTVVIDRRTGAAEYGTGGGIVWDSTHESEYRECFTKARILTRPLPPAFQILETLLHDPVDGWFLLEAHVRRAAGSAAYFGYPFSDAAMRTALDACVAGQPSGQSLKVRWLLSADGRMHTEAAMLTGNGEPWTVGIALNACHHDDVFLYHKTTNRHVYDEALRRCPGCSDVILVNEQGFVTESCYANVVLETHGNRVTPPVSDGLLNGTFREHLIARGELHEQPVTVDMLQRADRLWLINSVRKWIPVKRASLD